MLPAHAAPSKGALLVFRVSKNNIKGGPVLVLSLGLLE